MFCSHLSHVELTVQDCILVLWHGLSGRRRRLVGVHLCVVDAPPLWGNGRPAEWQNGVMTEWRNDRMKEWQNGGMTEWRNEGMTEWRNEGMTERRNDRMAEWRNEGMAEWRNGLTTGWRNGLTTGWRNGLTTGWRKRGITITYYFTTHTCVLVWQLQYSYLLIFLWLQSTSCVIQRVGGLHAERLWTSI